MFMSVIEKKMKKKIVEFIGRIQDGGAESLVKDYALMLDKDLFDVTILCEDYRKESSNYKTLISNGVKIQCMKNHSLSIRYLRVYLVKNMYHCYLEKQ